MQKQQQSHKMPIGTKNLTLIGHNIGYSLSPKIHGIIFDLLKLNGKYDLTDFDKDELKNKISFLKTLDGFNVTKPYKEQIISFLDENKSGFDSVNTVKNHNGRLIGYNTDVFGFTNAILRTGIKLKDKQVLVIGAGGFAQTAVPVLCGMGANVNIFNRTYQKAVLLADKNGASAVKDKMGAYDIIINCASGGLSVGENMAQGIDFSNAVLAYDAIYFETEFLQAAKNAGVRAENGLEFLILQALKADEIFFDLAPLDYEGLADLVKIRL